MEAPGNSLKRWGSAESTSDLMGRVVRAARFRDAAGLEAD